MNILDQIKKEFKEGSSLTRIILINIGVFALVQLVFILTKFAHNDYWAAAFIRWLAMPSDIVSFITKPWTLITYMFLHEGFKHLFWNLILLYFTGKILQEYLGGKRLTTIYIGGGILGGLLYFTVFNLTTVFGESGILIGASAGVMAVLFALTFYVPNLPVKLFFVLDVKLWHVAVALFLLDLSGIAGIDNAGGRIAHLGGALFGYLFISQLRKGNDWSEKAYAYADAVKQIFKTKPKLKTVHKAKTSTQKPKTDQSSQKRLDEILDKIKISGYEKLTKEEKEFLFKFSNK